MSSPILIQKQGYIAELIFNRPEKRNALNLETFTELKKQIGQLEADADIKVIVLRGVDDRAFAAGADISEFIESRTGRESAEHYNQLAESAIEALYRCKKPTIAVIQGFAIGGGLNVALSCDFRFSTENGVFGITPAKLGIVYDLASTKRLVDIVGPSTAKEILYTGTFLSSDEALAKGLINRVYAASELEGAVIEFADVLISRSQTSIQGSKQIIQAILDGSDTDTNETKELVSASFDSADFKEGVRAFLDKRKPTFH
ncbi:enoyl-CoA hydratase-related protein [Alkalicoccobacillus porphyridii]|uniref:Enoyl-CoA hydratase n=1 Tax=Alkalicoccobacillus porphyridii TaxID=2597270 RepID=A0A554A1M8_9BACI|nr:enoyl-CoA hydratase-related protein [Alkalicoccobacillus porphyridii]TSB47598.1 enoyl-CoA hydratase [Alkalicoccobacillus porphyridii]